MRALGVALLCVSGAVLADTGKLTDSSFVKQAALDGMTEVELANVANEKSSSPEVKTFAARMIQDHEKANSDLAALAATQKIKLPTKLDVKHKALVDMMKVRTGAGFDAAYAKHMSDDHGKAVELFTKESRSQNAELAAFARKTLPTLEEHKRMADGLLAKVGTNGKSG
jgi:putative membrane protein